MEAIATVIASIHTSNNSYHLNFEEHKKEAGPNRKIEFIPVSITAH